ncbi:MAG: polymerase sigma factor [Clostridia bacterium]|nr:polymerase sigma factor [Clostridia bacterium]
MALEQDPDRLLLQAREGVQEAREELIRRFTPFVLTVAARLTGRYIRLGEDDEASIGLIAFNEAIDNFDNQRNPSFLTFAEMVIRRRLIDYLRKEGRLRQDLPFSALETEGENLNATLAEAGAALEIDRRLELADRQAEILFFNQTLAEYNITLDELVRVSPRHRDARERALAAARAVASNPILSRYLKERKELPLKALEKEVETSRKTLERHRKYIIAMALIMMGDFDYLQEYIGYKKRGGGSGRR